MSQTLSLVDMGLGDADRDAEAIDAQLQMNRHRYSICTKAVTCVALKVKVGKSGR